jgi:hypothetical protein
MASPLVAALMADPNNIGMSEADHSGFGSMWGKLKGGMLGKMAHGLATLPARAGQAAVDYGDPLKGTYDPAPIMEAATTAITGGMPFAQAGALGSAGGKGIRAYHGSPHDFDRFDLSKIGTGEGAQAYGHGLYFAENEGVARQYRNALEGKHHIQANDANAWALGLLKAHGDDPARAIADIRARLAAAEDANSLAHSPQMAGKLKSAIELIEGGGVARGKMYEVNINAHPDQFLDWDKPLSGQGEAVRQALPQISLPGVPLAQRLEGGRLAPRGDEIYRTIQENMPGMGGKASATAALREAGIPGIKYLDQGSRTAGQGSSNYVVFDDKLIDILKKYGIPGILGGPGAMGAMASQEQQQ